MINYTEEQLTRALKEYIDSLVHDSLSEELIEFRAEINKSIKYIVDRTNKLNKIAQKLDMYITTGGELKNNDPL